MKAILLALVVIVSPIVAAQRLVDFEGTWRGSCSGCAPNAMPGGLARTLVIRISASEITIQRDGFPVEIYRLDGTETQLPDGRTATAAVDGESLVLTTVRRRSRSRDEVFQTLMRHTYRVSGNTLTIERSTRSIRPNEPPPERWVPLGTVDYQRN
jgi:hypothetical protein